MVEAILSILKTSNGKRGAVLVSASILREISYNNQDMRAIVV